MNEKNKSKKSLLLSYPFRESLGGKIAGINFKLGEIINLFLSFFLLITGFKSKGIKDKREKNILLCLIIIFFLALFPSLIQINSIDVNFFLKFIVKCLMILFFCYIMFSRNIMFTSKNISFLMKFIVAIELVFAIFQYIFRFRIINFSIVNTFSTFNIGPLTLERFSGTASEPGYLVPILALPTYYFFSNFKKNKFYFFASFIMLVLTFSSFAYITIFILALYSLKNDRKKRTFIAIFFILFMLFIVVTSLCSESFKNFIFYYINKATNYFTFGINNSSNIVEWSSADRSQHISNSINLFLNGNIFQIFFGHGTGGYSFLQSNNSSLLVEGVEEAYNLYLSSLTDRGIFGLLFLLLLFYNILKIPCVDNTSKSLKLGLIVQIVQYLLVGNLWLYFFWQNLVFLCGYNYYLNSKSKSLVKAC